MIRRYFNITVLWLLWQKISPFVGQMKEFWFWLLPKIWFDIVFHWQCAHEYVTYYLHFSIWHGTNSPNRVWFNILSMFDFGFLIIVPLLFFPHKQYKLLVQDGTFCTSAHQLRPVSIQWKDSLKIKYSKLNAASYWQTETCFRNRLCKN